MFDSKKSRQIQYNLRVTITAAVLIVIVLSIVFVKIGYPGLQRSLAYTAAEKTIAINGAGRWFDDEQVTVPIAAFTTPDIKTIRVAPPFAQYYQSHGGIKSLGNPITTAFSTGQGWVQFFDTEALFVPAAGQGQAHSDALNALINSGTKDAKSNIERLPVLQTLLTIGSQLPLGGPGSTFSYLDLRKAAMPDLMQSAPSGSPKGASSSTNNQGTFVKEGTRLGKDVGHFIPLTFWNYINSTTMSPDGWEADFGLPLTGALSFTIPSNAGNQHMLVQAFTHKALIWNQSTGSGVDQASIQQLGTGIDYLHTVGFPEITLNAQQKLWVQSDTGLLSSPETGNALVHIGLNYPLTAVGDSSWKSGRLWYHVAWSVGKHRNQGWIEAENVSFISPGDAPIYSSFDTLSPSLASYLASNGANTSAVVYDVSNQHYYTYNSTNQFIVASSMKIPIMLTFFDMIEQQGRGPTSDEMNLLTTMVENSDNDSASALYYNEINGATGISNYMQKIGITGLSPDSNSWGYSQITTQSMVNLLTLLNQGKILTAQDRSTAFNLMQHIEPDQQVGVGDTAPSGATVSMKDGWVPGPDNLWAMKLIRYSHIG